MLYLTFYTLLYVFQVGWLNMFNWFDNLEKLVD